MGPAIAFNATGIEGGIARDGFRVYLEPDGVYFLRVGDLDRLTAAGQDGDYTESRGLSVLLGLFGHPGFFLTGPRASRASGADLLAKMEETPVRDRLAADRANFVVRNEHFLSSAIRPGGGSFWRRGYGTWGFRTWPGRLAVLAFHSDLDRLVAQSHLPGLLGSRLEVTKV